MLEHQTAKIAEGEAGVEDVFDDDDVFALDGVVDVLDEFDGAGGDTGAAIAGDGDEVEGGIDVDGAGEIGEEDRGAFEDADENDGLTCVVGGDFLSEGLDAFADLRFLSRGCAFRRQGGRRACWLDCLSAYGIA